MRRPNAGIVMMLTALGGLLLGSMIAGLVIACADSRAPFRWLDVFGIGLTFVLFCSLPAIFFGMLSLMYLEDRAISRLLGTVAMGCGGASVALCISGAILGSFAIGWSVIAGCAIASTMGAIRACWTRAGV